MSMTHGARSRRSSRLEFGIYSILLFPMVFVAMLMKRLTGGLLSQRYSDDRRTRTGLVSETLTAINSSVWWSSMGR